MPRGKTKFDRCVKAVRRRGGAYDPRAVCGAMRARGELNPGTVTEWKKDFYRKGLDAGRRDRGASLPHFSNYSEVSSQAHYMADTAVQYHGVPSSKKSDLANQFIKGYSDGERGKRSRNPSVEVRPSKRFKGRWEVAAPGYPIETRKSKRGAISWANGWAKALSERKGGDWGVEVRENPAGAAAEAFKRFHGREPREFVTVTKKIHRHGNLWSLGTLRMLKIRTEHGQTVKLSGFKGAYLAANEQAFADLAETGRANLTQLYIEGGDQSVDLKSFGIDPERAHEVETLGKAIVIDYHTVKVHLGGEGGDAIYRHKFRTTREGDREVTLRVARYPDVFYRVLDQQLEFSGGSYEIRAEGIDK